MIDARKHDAPAAAETPRRQAINDLSLSIRDVIPVANTTERAQLVSNLTAAGQAPSVSNPLYVHRADARPGLALEYTENGTTWVSVSRESQGGVRAMAANTLASGATTSTGGTVVLGQAFADANYDVQLSLASGQAGTAFLVPRALSKTATGFVIFVYNVGSTSQSWTGDLLVNWRATAY